MDSSDATSGGERRRSSASRRSLSVSPISNESSSEESYEFADLSVADGFRPTDPTSQFQPPPQSLLAPPSSSQSRSHSPSPSHVSASSSRPQESQPSISTPPTASLAPSSNPAPIRSRPSSISKAHRPHESLSLRNDGSNIGDTAPATRPQLPTLSTGVPLLQNETDSERTDSTHPFASYGSRAMSDTTSSVSGAVREGEYNGPRGPTHPYALYPQNTAPMDDGSGEHIPVGFSGMGGSYQRQIGPDGEEAGDLIGPLGHMEELPPYTRYPEGAHVRSPQAEAAATGISPSPSDAGSPALSQMSHRGESQSQLSHSGQPLAAPDAAHLPSGAGGIGIATRNPEYSSTDENLSAERSARSAETLDSSRTDIDTIARDFAEKLPGGKWRRRARKKLLGVIPYWAICLLVVGLVIVGLVMGTVLGVLLTDDDGAKDKPDGDESGSTYGYKPTADVDYFEELPSGLAPLAVGLFDLPALSYRAAPKSCINDTTQGQAWNCDMPLRYYSIEIGIIPNISEVKNYNIQLEAINGSKSAFVWGTQPPNIDDPLQLRLVNDTFDISRGPAWWIEITYDKVVWVSESDFGQQNKRKRDWTYDNPLKEGFDPTRFMSGNSGPMNGENAWICTWPNVTMEIFIYPNQNSSSPPWSSTTALPSATSTAAPAESTKPPYDPTPSYPQVVKFLERRLFMDNDETAAVCKQVKLINDGHDTEDVTDDDGIPIEVVVTERQSSYEEMLEQQERSRHPDSDDDSEDRRRFAVEQVLRRETLELTDCACLWFSQ